MLTAIELRERCKMDDRRLRSMDSVAARATQAVALIQGKWTANVLLIIADGPVRTSELLRLLPLASKKMLIESLHHLESRGLIERIDLSSKVRHVEYRLPLHIRASTIELLQALAAWLPLDENVDPTEI